MARTVVGFFPDRRSAEHAIVDLKAAGFDPKRMGIVMRDREEARDVADDQNVGLTAGAVTGGVVGGTAGALLAATGALAVPGIGPFITGGVLASLVGGTAGSLIGGLTGMGLSHDEAQYYQDRLEQGGALVTADPSGRDEEARRIMFDNGAQDMRSEGGSTASTGTQRSVSDSEATHQDTPAGATAKTMDDTRRGMSREMLSGTMPNIPPDASRLPRQDSASNVIVDGQPLPEGQQRTLSDEHPNTGYTSPEEESGRMTRPAMDEDILQGRTHGTEGDLDRPNDRVGAEQPPANQITDDLRGPAIEGQP